MTDVMQTSTDAVMLRAFFCLCEWAFECPIPIAKREEIMQEMRLALGRNDATAREVVKYVLEQATIVESTPPLRHNLRAMLHGLSSEKLVYGTPAAAPPPHPSVTPPVAPPAAPAVPHIVPPPEWVTIPTAEDLEAEPSGRSATWKRASPRRRRGG